MLVSNQSGMVETGVSYLREIPLFSQFNDDQLRLVAFSAEPLELVSGTTLFRAGAPARSGFVIIEGDIRMTMTRNHDTPQEAVYGPGFLIGEMALLSQTDRPATATCDTDTKLLEIPRDVIRRVLVEYPDLAERLRVFVAGRLTVYARELQAVGRTLDAIDLPGLKGA